MSFLWIARESKLYRIKFGNDNTSNDIKITWPINFNLNIYTLNRILTKYVF